MNVARSSSNGFWWHVADNKENGLNGIYVRVGDQNGVVIPRDEVEALLDGLKEVLNVE